MTGQCRFCRNQTAESLYGYSASEALGQDAIELLIDPRDFGIANKIVNQAIMGERWMGQIPVKNKMGERFSAVATNTPFYDDDGTLVGIICVSSDSRPFQEPRTEMPEVRHSEAESSLSRLKITATNKLGLDAQQPLQVAIASKISNLVSLFALNIIWFIAMYREFIVGTKLTGIQGEQQSEVEDSDWRESYRS